MDSPCVLERFRMQVATSHTMNNMDKIGELLNPLDS